MIAIFTGSRNLPRWAWAEYGIEHFEEQWRLERPVYVGDCKTGLDAYVREQHTRYSEPPPMRVFEAEWQKHGRAAGPLRNETMVRDAALLAAKVGRDLVCFAFPYGKSPGTWDCIRRARAAGATLRIVEVPR